MRLIVQKYGGTSVGSLERIAACADRVKASMEGDTRVVVIVSAMGQQTDELLEMARNLSADPPSREIDMLLTAGERISMALLSIALHERGVPSVSLTGSQCGILTDETHGNARIERILGDRIRAGLEARKVVIVAGFQGVSPVTKEITTLGRGGSDLSALALAATLNATTCQLYKDVEGVFTADPRVVKDARLVRNISWDEMCSLAWAGASVLHARGATLARKFEVPFEVRSSFDLEDRGTIVKGICQMEKARVTALAHKAGLDLVQWRVTESARAQIIGKALEWLWQKGEAPQINRCHRDGGDAVVSHLVPRTLRDSYKSFVESQGADRFTIPAPNLATITMVGIGFNQSPELVAKVHATLTLTPESIDVRDNAVTICLPEAALEASLQSLHAAFVSEGP